MTIWTTTSRPVRQVAPSDAPWSIPKAARRTWANAYNTANRLLGAGRPKHLPRYSPGDIAAKVVADLYRSGRKRTMPGPSKMPKPGGLVYLGGPLLGVYIAGDDGRIRVHRFPRPPGYWSKKLSAVVAFPGLRHPPPTISAMTAPRLLALYEQWHDGKFPRGLSRMKLQHQPCLGRAYSCVATVYVSDKFDDDGQYVNYIHVHDKGVLARFSKRGILIRGGRLALTKDGLIH
jgi:hypothetical protein